MARALLPSLDMDSRTTLPPRWQLELSGEGAAVGGVEFREGPPVERYRPEEPQAAAPPSGLIERIKRRLRRKGAR